MSMKEKFGLYLILTDPVAGYERCAEAAVRCQIRYLQLRMKNGTFEEKLRTALRLREITRGTDTRFIVNDEPELAMRSDADGIHLGQGDLPLAEARQLWNKKGALFGVSTHSMDQAVQAAGQTPDYIGIGPVFATSTKADTDPELGPEEAGRIARAVPVTSVAIGGINGGNLRQVMECGSDNFCVVSAVCAADNPETAIRELQRLSAKLKSAADRRA